MSRAAGPSYDRYRAPGNLAVADLADDQNRSDDGLLHQVHEREYQTEAGLISDITGYRFTGPDKNPPRLAYSPRTRLQQHAATPARTATPRLDRPLTRQPAAPTRHRRIAALIYRGVPPGRIRPGQ
ncbi:hypothetical protein K7B10_39240 [Streptomyces flavotricini]|uniref:Uncharacterized protein n=1 Tax=Streptomyces flavotricini TaxID=66888 RepID=A0ABS8EIB6_9ACTN|nr:hypothetical protein [Streptomyces flavotricini]MCC0100688.1 hypothetical protein [Streptomyces flavotricini]